MADKRDYYEVLGVSRDADDAAIKRHTGSLQRSTILIQIPVIKKLKRSLKRHQKHMQC